MLHPIAGRVAGARKPLCGLPRADVAARAAERERDEALSEGDQPRRLLRGPSGDPRPRRTEPSTTPITRLKAVWEEDHQAWNKRSSTRKRYVYVWPDGLHFNSHLVEGLQCILLLIGATTGGGVGTDRHRRRLPTELTWKDLLLDVKAHGLKVEPSLAIGDWALGFWKVIRQIRDTAKEQRFR